VLAALQPCQDDLLTVGSRRVNTHGAIGDDEHRVGRLAFAHDHGVGSVCTVLGVGGERMQAGIRDAAKQAAAPQGVHQVDGSVRGHAATS